MKNFFLFCSAVGVLLTSLFPANARVNPRRSGNRALTSIVTPVTPRVFSIVQKQQAALAASRNSTSRMTDYPSERLIATSDYNLSYADTPVVQVGITDSSKFVYSGKKGSMFNPYGCNFSNPSASYFAGAGSAINNYFGGFAGRFTTNVNISDALADTAYYWNSQNTNLAGNDSFEYVQKITSVYDTNNNVSFCSDQQNPLDSSGQWDNVINTYDVNKNITSSLNLQWSGSAWDTNTYSFFYYNTSGQLIEDSTGTYSGTWAPSYKDYYTYNSSGLVNYGAGWSYSTTWKQISKVYFTYNTDNTLHTDSVAQPSGTTWVPGQTDSFGYTPGASFWTSLKVHANFSGGYEDVLASKHLNASNLPDSLKEMIYVSSVPTFPNHFVFGLKLGFTYDTYNNPTMYNQFNFTVTDSATGNGSFGAAAVGKGYYYYQNYIAAEVSKVSTPVPAVSIYPNPASDNINISISGIAMGAKTNISLENMLGQTMLSQSLPWMNDTETLPLSGIATGTYILVVRDASGNALASRKIIKQ